jgi:hypothetical protein
MQYVTYVASIHSTALCRFGGHNLIAGRINHSAGILLQSVHSIVAISFLAFSRFMGPKPHSVSRYIIVSGLLQCSHWSVRDSLMLCSRAHDGMISFITLYQVTFTVVDTGASCTFVHVVAQSVFGHRRFMRITG